MVFVCGNFFARDAYAITTYFSNSTFIASQIFSGDVVEQEFCLAEGDQGVQLLCGTYLTVLGDGRIVAELYDESGQKVSETEVSLQGTTDNSTVKIYFGDLDESLYNTTCKIKLTFLDMEDQLLALYASGFYTDEYDFYLNGEEQVVNIVMDGIRETVYIEYRDVRLFYVFGIAVFLLYIGMYKITWRKVSVQEVKEKAQSLWKQHWKQMLILLGVIVGSALLSGIIEYFAIQKHGYYNLYRIYAVFTTIFIIVFANVFKEYVWKKAQVYFFIVTMLVGTVTALSVPPTPVSWDEQIHYTKTTYMSWGATNRISGSDYLMSSMYTQANYYNIFEKSQREAWVEEVNEFDSLGGMMDYLQGVQASSVAYVPASMTLYAGRILGLDFVTRYTLGKLTNLFCYALFLATAVKCMQGRGSYWTVTLIIMGIAAAMDNSDVTVFRKNNRLAQAGGYIGVLGAIVLVLTALYVSYTPVGAHTVNGCQERYIIPILFPFLYFIGENRMTVPAETKRKAFVWINVCMSLIFMLAAYNSFVARY